MFVSLIPLLVFGFFIFVLIMIVRGLIAGGSRGGPIVRRPQVTTQLAQDGFWILSCPADPSAVIYYHFWSQGVRHSGQIPFQPDAQGRQFIYTGRQPEQVSIVRIVEDADDISSSAPPVIGSTMMAGSLWDTDTSSPPAPPSSSSFPSAY